MAIGSPEYCPSRRRSLYNERSERSHCENAALRLAVSRKSEALNKLLTESVSVDVRDRKTLSLWHGIAEEGLKTELKTLLNMGVNMEARDHQGNTALSLAAGKGHEGIVRFLLSEGANVVAEDYTHTPRSGGTPLSQAVLRPHIGVVRILLDAGAKVETRRQCKTGMTTLNRAVHPPFFNKAVVQVLL